MLFIMLMFGLICWIGGKLAVLSFRIGWNLFKVAVGLVLFLTIPLLVMAVGVGIWAIQWALPIFLVVMAIRMLAGTAKG